MENKELLLKYLCAALPYGVKVLDIFNEKYGVSKLINIGIDGSMLVDNDLNDIQYYPIIAGTKPYLRPMSSMTDEEKEEMHNTLSPEGTAVYENNGISIPMNHYGDFVGYKFMNEIIQYLLEHHFDFMDLIPKGLAIEVTESNNPYKE